MSITIGRYTFDGPYTSTDSLDDRSGIYAINCYRDGKYFLIDVGESATVSTRVINHDRKDCWQSNCEGTITYAVRYTPGMEEAGRMAIEQEIRTEYDPPCGKQ